MINILAFPIIVNPSDPYTFKDAKTALNLYFPKQKLLLIFPYIQA